MKYFAHGGRLKTFQAHVIPQKRRFVKLNTFEGNLKTVASFICLKKPHEKIGKTFNVTVMLHSNI